MWKWKPVHESHEMVELKGGAVLCPCSTHRIYGVRYCTKCGGTQAEHPAGRFMQEKLQANCKPAKNAEEAAQVRRNWLSRYE